MWPDQTARRSCTGCAKTLRQELDSVACSACGLRRCAACAEVVYLQCFSCTAPRPPSAFVFVCAGVYACRAVALRRALCADCVPYCDALAALQHAESRVASVRRVDSALALIVEETGAPPSEVDLFEDALTEAMAPLAWDAAGGRWEEQPKKRRAPDGPAPKFDRVRLRLRMA